MKPLIGIIAAIGTVIAFWPWVSHAFGWVRDRTNLLVAILGSFAVLGGLGIFAWRVLAQPNMYYAGYQTCGIGIFNSPARISGFKAGIAFMNRNDFPLYFHLEQATLTVEGFAARSQIVNSEIIAYPLAETKEPPLTSNTVPFARSLEPHLYPLQGRIRNVFRYGRDETHPDKTLIVNGGLAVYFRVPDGKAYVEITPDGDSSPHYEGNNCNMEEGTNG